ncbi:MAG: sugar phosphate nucleotidyltransferase [Verrucomicrobia bacterium]|nr:sugar phosphate nucleotidyltransferase [Verrucomicrobiota bacterium]
MRIKKAVITAAGKNQNRIPLQSLVDRDGVQKTALQIIIEEVVSGGVEEIAIVIRPGDQKAYTEAAGDWVGRITFVEQPQPRGYGHALYCSREFVSGEPLLHLVSDHLYVSNENRRCAQQLVEIATEESCSVSAVQATRESLLPYYGVIGGIGVPNRPHLFSIETVREKPTPTEAEQHLLVPGLRTGHYLCFFGMHVFTPAIVDLLAEQISNSDTTDPIHLSPALAALAAREQYRALEISGNRYNIGVKFGLLNAQFALALSGCDRQEVLAQLVELLAQRPQH